MSALETLSLGRKEENGNVAVALDCGEQAASVGASADSLQLGPTAAGAGTKTKINRLYEKHIIERVLQGNVDDYRVLVESYQNPIFSLMLRLTGSVQNAEDLTQDVFMRAYENLHKFNKARPLFPWLYTIALNHCRDFLRRRGIKLALFADAVEQESLKDPEGERCQMRADCALEVKQVENAVQKLPMIYRETLLMFFREELSLKEIAKAMGITVQAAKVRLHRGKELLRGLIGT